MFCAWRFTLRACGKQTTDAATSGTAAGAVHPSTVLFKLVCDIVGGDAFTSAKVPLGDCVVNVCKKKVSDQYTMLNKTHPLNQVNT